MIEEVLGDLHRAGEVKRGLAVPAAGVDKRGVGRDQFAESVDQPQAGCRVRVHDGAALDGVGGQFGFRAMEEPESSGPPAALGVDVGAGFEQDIEHLATADPCN